jgi:hypothetical protein
MKEQGTPLASSVIRQPGAQISISKTGFDSISQDYTTATSNRSALPRIFDSHPSYPAMIAQRVSESEDRLGITRASVTYEGIVSDDTIARKNEEFEISQSPQSIEGGFTFPKSIIKRTYVLGYIPKLKMEVMRGYIPKIDFASATFGDYFSAFYLEGHNIKQSGNLYEVEVNIAHAMIKDDSVADHLRY